MSTRSTADVPRIRIQRRAPLVKCTYANTLDERWDGTHLSCGVQIPFKPQAACPACGQKQIRAQAPSPTDKSRIITGPAQIVDEDTGEVVCVHWTGAGDLATRLAQQLHRVQWHDPVNNQKINNSGRLSGLRVEHRVFGYTPPKPMRKRYGCTTSRFNIDYPAAFENVEKFCLMAEWVFRTFAADVHEQTGQSVRETIPNVWRIAGTLWSSGIINNTAALPMHMDSANVPGSWSAMLACRKHMDGGLLYLSDYDCYLAVPHGSISIFDGQSVTHGVTPMRPVGPDAHRYTLVCYSKSSMRVCSSCREDEVKRAAKAATAAEDARIRK